jgi:hypothetical protein
MISGCDRLRISPLWQNYRYLISVLSIVPSSKRPKQSSKLRPKLNLQAEIIGCGIIDKAMMCEAANHSGTEIAIWVKYSLSFFHNNYNNKYYIIP